jgi:hypothetical protein
LSFPLLSFLSSSPPPFTRALAARCSVVLCSCVFSSPSQRALSIVPRFRRALLIDRASAQAYTGPQLAEPKHKCNVRKI